MLPCTILFQLHLDLTCQNSPRDLISTQSEFPSLGTRDRYFSFLWSNPSYYTISLLQFFSLSLWFSLCIVCIIPVTNDVIDLIAASVFIEDRIEISPDTRYWDQINLWYDPNLSKNWYHREIWSQYPVLGLVPIQYPINIWPTAFVYWIGITIQSQSQKKLLQSNTLWLDCPTHFLIPGIEKSIRSDTLANTGLDRISFIVSVTFNLWYRIWGHTSSISPFTLLNHS
jgi:hypothetical protein